MILGVQLANSSLFQLSSVILFATSILLYLGEESDTYELSCSSSIIINHKLVYG
ncbi:hypothetical protein HOF65_05510 [bacterium]|nr:hypothetical protein [bacterium]MBT3853401.1 hypothetical protein [bacterium]MBT4633144.1 hypothetical protein [bacterium]MBT6778915.1 hypothetical protein [bacterium]